MCKFTGVETVIFYIMNAQFISKPKKTLCSESSCEGYHLKWLLVIGLSVYKLSIRSLTFSSKYELNEEQ